MATRDDSTYILVHDSITDHPKIEGLSDAAFRLLIEFWCWCHRQRTDGRMPKTRWNRLGKPKTRSELLEDMVDDFGEYVEAHDYLDWQRSAAEAAAARTRQTEGGSLGNHRRWHVARGIVDDTCPYCDVSVTDRSTDSVRRLGGRVG